MRTDSPDRYLSLPPYAFIDDRMRKPLRGRATRQKGNQSSMKIEISVPVWGNWVEAFRAGSYPALNAEAKRIGADIVIYTDDAGRKSLIGCADEFRDLAEWDLGNQGCAPMGLSGLVIQSVESGLKSGILPNFVPQIRAHFVCNNPCGSTRR